MKNNPSRIVKSLAFLACIWMVSALHCAAQSWENAYIKLGRSDGLRGATIYDIFRDHHGYLWFGSDEGVSRYDGTAFEHFTVAEGLTDSEVFGIREDSLGRIWFLTRAGIPCYYYEGQVHNPKTQHFLQAVKAHGYASAFYADASGAVYLGYYDGNCYKVNALNQVRAIQSMEEVLKICPDTICRVLGVGTNQALGTYFMANMNDFRSMRPGNPRIEHLSDITVNGANNYPIKYLNVPSGETYITWGRNLRRIGNDLRDTTYKEFISQGKILGIFSGGPDKIYLSTTEGAIGVRVDGVGPVQEDTILKGRPVNAGYVDEHQGVWVGSADGAYYKPASLCRRLVADPAYGKPSAVERLWNGGVLIGYENGNFVQYDAMGTVVRTGSIGLHRIGSFHQLDSTTVWVRSTGGMFEISSIGVRHVHDNTPRALDVQALDTTALALCGHGGWALSSPSKVRGASLYQLGEMFTRRKNAPQCFAIKFGVDGELWVSAADGMHCYKDGDSLDLREADALVGYSTVRLIQPIGKGNVLLGTAGNGVVAYLNGHFRRFAAADGLSSDFITALDYSPPHKVWIGSGTGIDLLEIMDGQLEYHVRQEFASHWLWNQHVVDIAADAQQLFVATDEAVYQFAVDSIMKRVADYRLQLQAISTANRAIHRFTPITLDVSERELQFDFAAITFLSAGKVQYRYRLYGLQDDWTVTPARNVRYSKLPPGKFEFQLQARFPGEPWSDQMLKCSIQIPAYFYEQIWFKVFVVLLALAVLGSIGYYFFNNYRRRADLVKRTLVAEQSALMTQMNPHFIFNSLNSIQYFYLTNDRERANEFLSDFGLLIRAILENGRQSKILLEQELELIELYIKLEQVRLRGKFDYQVEVLGINPKREVIPPMIIQPFLENAIWHGLVPKEEGRGQITLRFLVMNDCLQVEVEDNGIGRVKAADMRKNLDKEHKSLATEIIRERLTLLGMQYPGRVSMEYFDLYDEFDVAMGTKVVILLPHQPIR